MRIQLNFLIFLFIVNVYSQKKYIIPVKPIKSYELKIRNINGKYYYQYNDDDSVILRGEYNIYQTKLNSKTDIVNSYYNTGYEFIGFFNKGYKTGLWKTTYKNKVVKTINYKNGLVIGKYRVYDIKGNLLYKTTFGSKGNGEFKDYYYTTGVLKQEGDYENGKKQGEWCNYNEYGELKDSINYNNGMPQ